MCNQEVSRVGRAKCHCSRANSGKDMYKCAAGVNLFVFFANWDLFILLPFSLPSPFSSTRFYFLFLGI